MRPLPRLLLLLTLSCATSLAGAQTRVETFSPEGTVKKVRQVTARFSAQMVPFGDLRLSDPFTIACSEKGTGRWVDGSNWAYDFERDLAAGVRCTFTLKPGLKDVAGKDAVAATYSFNTGGPAVVSSMPREGWTVDENQVFLLGLDAEATPASVSANAWCRAGGVNERIALDVLKGKERDQVLASQKRFVERHMKRNADSGGKPALLVVRCKRTFAAKQKVDIVWGRGIAATTGVATHADQVLPFDTRPDFTARFSCERMTSKGHCIPFLPVRLNFSAPINAATAGVIQLQGGDGKAYPAVMDKEDQKRAFVSNISFKGPLPENTAFKIVLPPNVRDDAGRALANQSQFPLSVRTGDHPPLVKFPARFGIIEAVGERMLPVTVRNVEAAPANKAGSMLRVAAGPNHDAEVLQWLQALGMSYGSSFNEQQGESLTVSALASVKPANVEKFVLPRSGDAKTFEVIGIPLPKPGFYVVELESPILGAALMDKKNVKAYVNSAALVTNMAAHFKRGAESSLVVSGPG